MKKFSQGDADTLNNAMPANQATLLGTAILGVHTYGDFQLVVDIPAGAVGLITPLPLDARPENRFDFEILDVLVRTDTTVTSSTVQIKKGTTAVTDAIVSATAKALTRAGTLDVAQNKFKPFSDPTGYATNPLNIVDAGGATAAARTVVIYGRRI